MLTKEVDCCTIESEMLNITTSGKTMEEAEIKFFKEFDSLYIQYNKLTKANSTYNIFRIKRFLKSKVVKSLKNSNN